MNIDIEIHMYTYPIHITCPILYKNDNTSGPNGIYFSNAVLV